MKHFLVLNHLRKGEMFRKVSDLVWKMSEKVHACCFHLPHQCIIHICNSELNERACLLPCDTHSVSVVSVLSVCVCEAWLFRFTEKLCWMSVSLRRAGRLLCCTVCVHGRTYTPIPVPALVWVFLEFAPTNRPLNLTHTQHTQTQKQARCSHSDNVLECVSRHNSNRTTFESSPILRKPVGFPGANEMPARQMDMREPQSDPTLGSK